ncbi:hypothetical protein ACFYNM_31705 [Streptomyces spororaveus]
MRHSPAGRDAMVNRAFEQTGIGTNGLYAVGYFAGRSRTAAHR